MADIKISLKIDEQLRKDLLGVLKDTVKSMPSSVGNAVRSGAKEKRIPVKEFAESISEAREKALLAMLPEELRPGKREAEDTEEQSDE